MIDRPWTSTIGPPAPPARRGGRDDRVGSVVRRAVPAGGRRGPVAGPARLRRGGAGRLAPRRGPNRPGHLLRVERLPGPHPAPRREGGGAGGDRPLGHG